MDARTVSVAVAVLALSGPAVARGQTATLIGAVMRDTSGHELGAAEIVLPDLKRGTQANYLGAFKFDKLPAGRHAIVIRHIGFSVLYDTIDVRDGARIEREFVMTETPRTLDSVQVRAPAKKYISPGLQAFEERRKEGFGHFVTEDVLRKNDHSTMLNVVLGYIPGLAKNPKTGYVGSMRKCGDGPVILGCGRTTMYCPPTLYIDGVLSYDAPNGTVQPDFSRMSVMEYAAVEYYSTSTTPAQYNRSSAGCGTLLLWTRER